MKWFSKTTLTLLVIPYKTNHSTMKKTTSKLTRHFSILLGAILMLTLYACDPARILTLQNNTGEPIELEIEFEACESHMIQSLTTRINSPKTALGNRNGEKKMLLFFGLGGWRKKDLDDLLEYTKSIKVIEKGKPERIIQGEELREALPKKRKGILNSYMKITISK